MCEKLRESGNLVPIIFLTASDEDHDEASDHVGIVESCDGTTVHTVEGNSGDRVKQNSYSINSPSILGYGLVYN